MTAKSMRFVGLTSILLSMGLLGGCGLRPEPLDEDLLTRYQQRSLATPPVRTDAVQPVPGSTGLPLEVKTDETGLRILELSLEEAIYRALMNNLDIKVVAYDPAITRERYIQAVAAFDTVLFAETSFDRRDSRSATSFVGNQTKTYALQAGVRQPLTTGGELSFIYELDRTRTSLSSAFTSFNPSYSQSLLVQLTQPLLRGAGETFARSQINIARINQKVSLAQFRAQVLDVVNQIQSLYWQLVRARQELFIQERLLERTQETYKQVYLRSGLDATQVQVMQAAAAVETRRATVIRARKTIFDIQDQLVRRMADASITLLDDVTVVPVTRPSRAELLIDPADQVAVALQHSPELEQARRAIDIGDINIDVACNQELPRLDVVLRSGINGLDDHWDDSWNTMWQHNYIDYFAGLEFEYPVGNRARRAATREAWFTRYRSLAVLQNTADEIAEAVNESIRQIYTTYEEIGAQAAAVQANEQYLRAIVAQEIRQALTPEFLQLRLAAQEALAASERAELQAVVDFNIAQAQLNRVTGGSLEMLGVVVRDSGEDFVRLVTEQTVVPDLSPEATAPRPVQSHLPEVPRVPTQPTTRPLPMPRERY